MDKHFQRIEKDIAKIRHDSNNIAIRSDRDMLLMATDYSLFLTEHVLFSHRRMSFQNVRTLVPVPVVLKLG